MTDRDSIISPVGADAGSILIIGASRGLGLAMAESFAGKGWAVMGTVRGNDRTGLHTLADRSVDRRVAIETVDITEEGQLWALRRRLDGRRFDILFVNAGITNANPAETIGEVTTEEFTRVMVTNALGPMRAVEVLDDLVAPDGLIGVMSSGQGSIANNERGQRELYRGSKAALNMFMRSYAARQAGGGRSLLLMAPGWVRTELGGAEAPLSIEDSIPSLVAVMLGARGTPGLRYLDYRGRTVPW